MNKRRFSSKDFENNNDDNVVVNMNDIKGLFREWMMMKIDEDLEDMIRKYMSEKVINDIRL
tara:strand:- start:4073 stop:4255 length:183 start_codon:yes stop_codon:yes gene_type:complete